MLRNQLMQMTVRQGGQLNVFTDDQLPGSMYEQVSAVGRVSYQNRSLSFEQFASQGLPMSGTIDLPILPNGPVRVGQTWQTPNVPLAVPSSVPEPQVSVTGSGNINTFAEAYTQGTAGELLGTFVVMKKPTVTISSKLEDLEWEGGYPTAHIIETFDGTAGPKMDGLIFGDTFIQAPLVKYRRDIYIAFKSGLLVKMVQKLEVSGSSPQYANASPTGGYGTSTYGQFGGSAMAGGAMGAASMGGRRGASMAGGRGRRGDDDEDGGGSSRGGASMFGGVGGRGTGMRAGAAGGSRGVAGGAYGLSGGSRRSSTGRGSSYGGYGTSGAPIGSGYSNPPALTSASGAPGTITGNTGQVTMRTTTTTEIDHGDVNQLTIAY